MEVVDIVVLGQCSYERAVLLPGLQTWEGHSPYLCSCFCGKHLKMSACARAYLQVESTAGEARSTPYLAVQKFNTYKGLS